MSADVIAWLESPEGEEWSRDRTRYQTTTAAPRYFQWGPGDPAEDPTGRGPITPGKDAATGDGAA